MADTKIIGAQGQGRGRDCGHDDKHKHECDCHADHKTIGGKGTKRRPFKVIALPGAQPFAITTTTIYARPGGNDKGKGTLEDPFATFVRAVQEVPLILQPGARKVIDITGITEVLPTGYVLPPWKSDFGIGFADDPNFLFTGAVGIQAIPQPVPLSPASDAVINPGEFVATSDPNTALVTLTLTGLPRLSWAGDALKGKQIRGAVGFSENAVIYESDTTFIKITTNNPPTAPMQIVQPGATLMVSTSSAANTNGGLTASDIDSIDFSGLKIVATDGGFGLSATGRGQIVVQMCELESPDIEQVSPSIMSRMVRDYIYGFPFFASGITILQGLMDNCVGWGIQAGAFINITREVIQNSDPIEVMAFMPGAPAFPATTPLLSMFQALVRGGTGDGVIFHGSMGRINNADIYGCVGNGVRVQEGSGMLEIFGVASSGPLNGGVGVLVNDGMSVKVDAGTSGNATPLTGASGDMQVGVLPVRTWSDFTTVAPINNEYDLVAMNAGATDQSTGSRLSQ